MSIRRHISDRRPRLVVRVILVVIMVVGLSLIGSAYLDRHESVDGPTATTNIGDRVAGESDGTTVITTQGKSPTEVPRAAVSEPNGALYAINSSGQITYVNTTYHAYWDVDPVPDRQASVLYVAAEFVPAAECGTERPCYIRHVQVANLTTGDVRQVYSDITYGDTKGKRWHDVDRYDSDSILVADISENRVTIVNTSTGLVEWSWQADTAFAPASGGEFGLDWTHLNDVELLPDGRIMADLRNQDAVVFLDPETGLQERWTLGSDGDHDVIYEQHNPDYIPEPSGGPAVLVADSLNNRIVEYQRIDGDWEQSWVWQDRQMQWPRDADRLPNGHTLITDTNSNRVFEINEAGEIIWRVTADNPYEAERLETGDESRGGESATRLGLESYREETERQSPGVYDMTISIVPDVLVNAIVFVKPVWMEFYHIAIMVLLLGTVLIWAAVEFYWSGYRLTVQNPLSLTRE